jgi:heme/copper-type cytochrome/quinol oxidase subunit 2
MFSNVNRLGVAIGLSMAVALGVAAFVASPVNAHPTIDIAVANWKFTPAKITIPAGEPSVLRFTSTQGVHGVQSDELGIKQTTLGPGKSEVVTFTPAKPGTYVMHCSIMCGQGHPDMALTIVVADATK